MNKRNFIITLISVILTLPVLSFAQVNATITLTPTNPTPNSSVTLTLTSYAFDVNQSLITWRSNGRELLKGIGEKSLVVNTGDVGTVLPIQVGAVTPLGETVELSVNISPQSVSIIYETPESYVPLFYEGRSLPGEGAVVKFVALPNVNVGGQIASPQSLSYSWHVNGSFVDKASGFGRQSAEIPLGILTNKTDVRVVVNGPSGTLAENRITVYPHSPMPIFYIYDDILGVKLNESVVRRFEAVKPFTVSLEPFYVSTKGVSSNATTYTWLLNGAPVTASSGRLLALRPKEDSYGTSRLSVSIANSLRRLQKGFVDVEIIFDTRR